METSGGVSSKSRRKTFTVQQGPPPGPGLGVVSASPLQTSNICNRTFITGGGDDGGGGDVTAEEIVSRKVVEKKQPLPEPSVAVNNKNNNDPLIVTPASLYSMLVQQPQPRPAPTPNANASILPPSLPNGPGPAAPASVSSNSLFSRGVYQSIGSKPEELLNRLCSRRNANFGKLASLVCDGVSVMDITSSPCGSEPLFETTSVEGPRRKPRIELEQLRMKEKSLLDEISRIKTATMLYEKEHKGNIKKVEADIKGMEKKILSTEKRQEEIKKETEAAIKTTDETYNQTTDVTFKVDVRNAFLQTFLSLDENYKCKDSRFCKEFHQGGVCFPEST